MNIDDYYIDFEETTELFDFTGVVEVDERDPADESISKTVMQKIEIYLEEKNLLSNIIEVFD